MVRNMMKDHPVNVMIWWWMVGRCRLTFRQAIGLEGKLTN